jgi:hypothetical protein
MKRPMFSTLVVRLSMLALTGAVARADDGQGGGREFRANLRGATEVPSTLTTARGTLRLTVSEDQSSVHFVLSYQGLETPILFAHIHVGQTSVNGAVTVFFCGGGGRPACPDQQGSGTVEGDITAANVMGIVSQQLPPNDLARLLRAIRAGETYANLHTQDSPGGEIRGQIMPASRHEGGD